MDDFLHHALDLGADDTVEVRVDHQANVLLLDDANFARYRRREPFQYHGGSANPPAVSIAAPGAGRWHLVVDLGGFAGTISPAVRVLHPA